jgi:NADH-quinone oxidoreductase subunit L
MTELVWMVPLLPLLGAAANGLLGPRWIRARAHVVAVGAAGLALAVAGVVFLGALGGEPAEVELYTWVAAGDFEATVGFLVDGLSATMMLVVTLVGFLIHVYSIGYMHGDRGYARFFAYLNLFMFAMLTLVLANNYLLMFLGWEGVGLCSYLLIGFWFEKKSASDAGKKAFVVNRIGDLGFILGLFLILTTFGSLHFETVFGQAGEVLGRGSAVATAIALLLFVGAAGKSAQLPLYVWLPDAMEGPTPVSALIHAATMVTAGVYMVARSAALYELAPAAMTTVAVVGALTALFAATIALVQNDIKRVVAYSTISQLGYMFLGCGVGAHASAIFHLATHAFFKALLFLGAGSVIHGLQGEQDIRRMGGLRRHMPVTAWTFLVASLANVGIFPLAGFWSKDEILAAALAGPHGRAWLWLIGTAGALCTAFYMFRLYFVVFEGRPRVDPHVAHHIHESPPNMRVPLVLLAIGSALAGFLGLPPDGGLYHRFVEPVFAAAGVEAPHLGVGTTLALMLIATLVGLAGIGLAYRMYVREPALADRLAARAGGLYRLLLNKYWVDELYEAIFVHFGKRVCRGLWRVDAHVVDGAVNGTGWLTVRCSWLSHLNDSRIVDGLVNAIADLIQGGGFTVRRLQTGLVQNYLLVFAFGLFAIVGIYLFAL